MKFKILFVAVFLFSLSILANDIEIKSLKVYQNNQQTSFPILFKNSKITIEFDIKSDYQPNLEILFVFCDQNWEPYEDYIFANDLYNTERNLWFEVLPFRSDRARYHYKGSFPNENVNFPFSGKWQFYIIDTDDPDYFYESGKFYVINQNEVHLKTSLKSQRLEGRDADPAIFGQIYNLRVAFQLPDSLFTQQVKNIEIVENRKIEYPIILDKSYDNQWRYYEIDGAKSLSFYAKDIQPGGEYRQANLMNKTKYTPPKVYARFDGIDISRKFKPSGNDFNGGSKLMNYEDEYAEYMDAEFRLRLPDNYYQNIFLVGAFNNWKILPEYLMEEDDGYFTKTIELKRGIYDYQYVTADLIDDYYIENESWIELEGNDWRTKNEYYIFLYYDSPEIGGYDKIIGFAQLKSGLK
ncbi:MAG: type IX secretion system plug protein domain-containing protein [Bacteroidota bacterium]